jgi:hypothetical protein
MMRDSPQVAPQSESLSAVRERVLLATTFAWSVVSGLSAIVFREKGEKALNDLWSGLMRAEQGMRFKDALRKLGIEDGPPAVVAARYHYFSNSIGGLRMHYIEESPKKVWIRYLAPWGTFPGIAALAVPTSVRRTILSTWHPRNGDLLGCPRLGWVLTKSIADGHPYDEGYFMEYDQDLRPEERMRIESCEMTPEFDPAKAPVLDSALWPESRVQKASANYASDYVAHTIETMQRLFGAPATCQLIEQAMRLLAVQTIRGYVDATSAPNAQPAGLAHIFAAILRSFRNECDISQSGGDEAQLRIGSFAPFTGVATDAVRRAIFQFVVMGVRVLNGRVNVTRSYDADSGVESWTFVDRKRWLW